MNGHWAPTIRGIMRENRPRLESFLLLSIVTHRNEMGDAWPSMRTFADETASTVEDVSAALDKLDREGVIHRSKRGKYTVYRLESAPNVEPEPAPDIELYTEPAPLAVVAPAPEPVESLPQPLAWGQWRVWGASGKTEDEAMEAYDRYVTDHWSYHNRERTA